LYILPSRYFRHSGTAGIWLPPDGGFDDRPPSFDDLKTVKTSLLAPSLNHTFFKKIPGILSRPVNDVSWHYNPNCRGCPYNSSCSERAVEEGELGRMSNITQEDAKVLRTLLTTARRNRRSTSTDIEDLAQVLENKATMTRVSRSLPMTVKKARKILSLPVKDRGENISRSPTLDAALTGEIQV
jgi:hypothetical protein